MKYCRSCKSRKEASLFFKDISKKDGRGTLCKECKTRKINSWKAKNTNKVLSYRRKTLLNKYSLSEDDQAELLRKQQHKCKICDISFNSLHSKNMCIDHDHVTNKVRGILCSNCNLLLGYSKDNISTLEKAISYLKDTNG